MTQEEYWDKVNETFLLHLQDGPENRWRWGQTCMNVLYETVPDLYRVCAGTENDPWNAEVSSPTYERFVQFINKYWSYHA